MDLIQSSPSLAILLSNPVACFGASIPDGVASLQANPLGDGPVLLLGLGQLLLGAERLVGLSQRLGRRVYGMLEICLLLGVVQSTYRHLDGVRMSSVLLVGGRLVSLSRSLWLRDKFEWPSVWTGPRTRAKIPATEKKRHVHSTFKTKLGLDSM